MKVSSIYTYRMSLRDKMLGIVYQTLKENDFNRSKTYQDLEISKNTLRTYINELRAMGYEIEDKTIDSDYSCFPTNEERLQYKDLKWFKGK